MPSKKDDGPEGAPEWMCTFSDMMSLLLCFFVLLFSLSSIEKLKFVQAIASIQGALDRIPNLFNTSYIKPIQLAPQKVEPVQRTKTIERAKEAIAKKAKSKLVADESSKDIVIEGVKEGIRFSISGRLLFAPGQAVISQEGKRILDIVAEELKDFPTLKIRIEGHTDSSPPPSTSQYRDNWKLAYWRAFNTFAHFRDNVDPEYIIPEEQMSVMSCSDNRPRFPNDTIENRALNRRVEIVLLQGSESEMVQGVLEGTGEPRIIPDETDFLPSTGSQGPSNSPSGGGG